MPCPPPNPVSVQGIVFHKDWLVLPCGTTSVQCHVFCATCFGTLKAVEIVDIFVWYCFFCVGGGVIKKGMWQLWGRWSVTEVLQGTGLLGFCLLRMAEGVNKSLEARCSAARVPCYRVVPSVSGALVCLLIEVSCGGGEGGGAGSSVDRGRKVAR